MRTALATLLFSSSLIAGFDRWTTGGPPEPWITSLAIAPSNSAVLYAVSASGQLFARENAGEGWEPRSSLPITRIIVHPSSLSVVFAHTITELLRSNDGGRTWSPLGAFPSNLGVGSLHIETLALAPSNPSVLYAGLRWVDVIPGGTISRGNVFKSTDAGASWTPTGLREAGDVGTRALTVDPTNASVVYAVPYSLNVFTANNGRGVVRSVDGGVVWSPPVFGFNLAWVLVDPQNSGRVFAGPSENAFYRSSDGLQSYTRIALPLDVGVVSALAVDPTNSLRFYAATSRQGVQRSVDGGASWTAFNCGLAHLWATQIAVNGEGRLLSVGTRWGGVFNYELPASGHPLGCVDADRLCLGAGGRFCIQIEWRAPDGRTGFGRPVPLTIDTGAFWFFESSNLELMIKVLDGTHINGRFWVFYGSLSNVEYEVTVTENETGTVKTYRNAPGQVASVTDTEAF